MRKTKMHRADRTPEEEYQRRQLQKIIAQSDRRKAQSYNRGRKYSKKEW